MRSYTIIVTEEPDGSAYNVSVPALDGCFTYGVTLTEAIEHAHDAIRTHVESLVDDGESLPDDVKTLLTTVHLEVPEVAASV